MGSLIVSASKGELVLSFGSSDSKMKGVVKSLVLTAGWVAVRFWICSGIACLCPFFGLVSRWVIPLCLVNFDETMLS